MNSDTLVIERALSLKDVSPFILVEDNFAQSCQYLVKEIMHRINAKSFTKIYLSFESVSKPPFITQDDLFVDCLSLMQPGSLAFPVDQIVDTIKRFLSKKSLEKVLIIIDSLNYISSANVSNFVSRLMVSPNVTILATLHMSVLESEPSSQAYVTYPSKLNLLSHIATSIFEVSFLHDRLVEEEYDEEYLHRQYYGGFLVPIYLNNKIFKVKFTKFKKSGKKLEFEFKLNSSTHEFFVKKTNSDKFEDEVEEIQNEEENDTLLNDLSTFNLSTTSRQKQAKDQVELPFLEAQKFQDGGAIVYQFEKDDDYDEEDPYEDPF